MWPPSCARSFAFRAGMEWDGLGGIRSFLADRPKGFLLFQLGFFFIFLILVVVLFLPSRECCLTCFISFAPPAHTREKSATRLLIGGASNELCSSSSSTCCPCALFRRIVPAFTSAVLTSSSSSNGSSKAQCVCVRVECSSKNLLSRDESALSPVF